MAADGVIALRITHAKPKGTRLRADKGINLPDSNLQSYLQIGSTNH